MNIFPKHAIPSYYWDSSLSQNKFLFYFLSVMASIMNPNICDFKKAFFMHYSTDSFISFICDLLFSNVYI